MMNMWLSAIEGGDGWGGSQATTMEAEGVSARTGCFLLYPSALRCTCHGSCGLVLQASTDSRIVTSDEQEDASTMLLAGLTIKPASQLANPPSGPSCSRRIPPILLLSRRTPLLACAATTSPLRKSCCWSCPTGVEAAPKLDAGRCHGPRSATGTLRRPSFETRPRPALE